MTLYQRVRVLMTLWKMADNKVIENKIFLVFNNFSSDSMEENNYFNHLLV